jgi:hypothetical protein
MTSNVGSPATSDRSPAGPATQRQPTRAALAGFLAGPLFLGVVVLLTWADIGTLRDLGWRFVGGSDVPWPSGLALGDYGGAQVANFVATGFLLFVFARGFRWLWQARSGGRPAFVALTVLAASVALSAFPTDHATAAGRGPDTWHGTIHIVAFILLGITSLLAPAFTAWALSGRPQWEQVRRISMLVPLLMLLSFVASVLVGAVAFLVYLVIAFGWVTVLARGLLTIDAS